MPIYVVVEINDEIEDVQGIIAELSDNSEDVTLDVGGYRFNQATIRQIGTRYPR